MKKSTHIISINYRKELWAQISNLYYDNSLLSFHALLIVFHAKVLCNKSDKLIEFTLLLFFLEYRPEILIITIVLHASFTNERGDTLSYRRYRTWWYWNNHESKMEENA